MEDPRFQKASQGYHHGRRVENRPRFFRNRKEEIHSNHKPSKQGGQLEEDKAHYVKSSYVPCEQMKNLEAKPELALGGSRQDAVNKDQNKPSMRRKDAKECKTSFKDGERRYYPSKENGGRPFKTFHAGKPQNRTKERSTAQVNDEINTKKGQHKTANELRPVKQKDVGATQYSKPAVHVQPLQQLSEGGHSGVTGIKGEVRHTHDPSNFDLLSKDSSQQPHHILNEQHGIPGNILENDPKKERSLNAGQSMRQEKSEKPLPNPVQKSLEKIDDKMDKVKAGSGIPKNTSYQDGSCLQERSNLVADVKSNNMKTVPSFRSSASGLPHRLKSSQASLPTSLHQMVEHRPKGPTNGVVTDASVKTSESNCHYLAKEEKPLLKMPPAMEHNEPKDPLVPGPHGELQQLKSLEPQSNEKYGYRISVDSLFSSSFFENPQVNSNGNNELLDSKRRLFENDESRKRGVNCSQAPTVDLSDNQTSYTLDETPKFSAAKTDITQANDTSFLPHDNSFPSPPLATRTADFEQIENFDVRVVSPRSRSQNANESSHLTAHAGSGGKFSLASPRNELLRKSKQCEVESECRTELVNDIPFGSQDINVETYNIISDHVEDTFCNGGVQNNSLTLFPSVKSSKVDIVKGKEPTNSIQQLNPNEILKDSERQQGKNISGMHTSSLTDRHDEPLINSTELPTSLYPCARKEDITAAYPANTNKISHYTETQLHSSSSEMDKDTFEKQSKGSVHGDGEDMQAHQATFSQGPYMPNPFLGHSLLTHRHAIPSAFVYPSRVGIPGGHSGFNDVGQHAGTSPSSHLFPPHGTTVCINVGGRLFEVLPSTFAPYPESLLYQIFTGATSSPINQRGHIFFDRDGYLFEIILAFARVGNLTLPPRLSLTSLTIEAKFFGMYEYMFKQGQLPVESSFHFQRTTCCTLFLDVSTSKSATKVFVLQGEDKLKIESLKVSGACNLYVDLYTPSGVKETSNFLLYDSERPNLWKAYQFCAERQLVFHLGRTNTGIICAVPGGIEVAVNLQGPQFRRRLQKIPWMIIIIVRKSCLCKLLSFKETTLFHDVFVKIFGRI